MARGREVDPLEGMSLDQVVSSALRQAWHAADLNRYEESAAWSRVAHAGALFHLSKSQPGERVEVPQDASGFM